MTDLRDKEKLQKRVTETIVLNREMVRIEMKALEETEILTDNKDKEVTNLLIKMEIPQMTGEPRPVVTVMAEMPVQEVLKAEVDSQELKAVPVEKNVL